MPTLNDWRHILSHGISKGLGVEERGYLFPVYHYYVSSLDVLPCGVLQPGGPSGADYTTDTPGEPDDQNTFCQFMARYTLWLFVANPNTEDAANILDDLIYRLHTGALGPCVEDELNPEGFLPACRGATQVYEITYGESIYLSSAVDLVVPVS